MAINQKVLAIQQGIQVEKGGFNEKHGFAYFREEDVVNAVKAELNERSIIVRYETLDYKHEGFYDSNGRYRPRANATVRFTFIDVEDDSEFSVVVAAEGSGTGDDVSSRKLATMARKIAFLQVFQIGETNERYDSDSQPEQEPINNSTPAERPLNASELKAKVGDIVRDADNPVTGAIVNTIGSRIAKEKGLDETPAAWMKSEVVLTALLEAVKRGEVE